MKHWIHKTLRCSMLLMTLLISGCFHLRSAEIVPPELRTLYFTTDNVYGALSEDLKRKLQGSQVLLVDSEKDAPLTLYLFNSKTTTDIPIMFNSLVATTYTYTMSVNIKLTDHKGNVFFQSPVVATESVVHNVNQVSPPVLTPLMRRTLTTRLVNSIYNIFTSTDIARNISQQNAKHNTLHTK